jgi:undecaprenyl-diphosphatase
MSWAEAMLLAVVQGLTEFLPVSSSGHLAAIQNYAAGFGEADLAYDVLLHAGTLVAVVIYYWQDLTGMARSLVSTGAEAAASRRLMWMVGAGTVPAAVGYLLFADWIEGTFSSMTGIGVGFLVTGAVLFATRMMGREGRGEAALRWSDALIIGVAQMVAMLPSVSRSGSTIAAALWLGLDRGLAVRYSFLLSIPAIVGANLVKARVLLTPGLPLGMWLIGAAISLVLAYATIHILLRVVRTGHLAVFAYYCWAVGAAVLVGEVFR